MQRGGSGAILRKGVYTCTCGNAKATLYPFSRSPHIFGKHGWTLSEGGSQKPLKNLSPFLIPYPLLSSDGRCCCCCFLSRRSFKRYNILVTFPIYYWWLFLNRYLLFMPLSLTGGLLVLWIPGYFSLNKERTLQEAGRTSIAHRYVCKVGVLTNGKHRGFPY